MRVKKKKSVGSMERQAKEEERRRERREEKRAKACLPLMEKKINLLGLNYHFSSEKEKNSGEMTFWYIAKPIYISKCGNWNLKNYEIWNQVHSQLKNFNISYFWKIKKYLRFYN